MTDSDSMQLDFNKARKKIIREELTGNNPVPDLLGFLHLKRFMDDDYVSNLHSLIVDYGRRSDNIHPLLKIDSPKANYAIRPMARPIIKEWLIYEAIVGWLAKQTTNGSGVCKRSYSILRFKSDDIKPIEAWLQFDERTSEFFEKGYTYVVLSDLTGYYENVHHGELNNRIIECVGDVSNEGFHTYALLHMLNKWSDERIRGYGLPQGPPGSAFLADIYLDPVDRRMEKFEGYFRYMDDIRICCKSKIEAKTALKELIIALRDLKLNINAKKTRILQGYEVRVTLFDPQKSLMNLIETTMRTKDSKQIERLIPHLVQLLRDSFQNAEFGKRHLRFSLYRLGILHMSGIEFDVVEICKLICNNFVEQPHHADLFLNFLSMFPDDSEIASFLLDFLRSDNNIYDMQELKTLRALLIFNIPMASDTINFFIDCANDSNKHFAVRALYFVLVGKFGANRDRNLIASSYDKITDDFVKSAIILATQELPTRDDFYSRVKTLESNQETKHFLDYVKSLSQPAYYMSIERPKIETYESIEEPGY